MDYRIILPRRTKGIDLRRALGQTAARFGLNYEEYVRSYFISHDSKRNEPDDFTIHLSNGRFGLIDANLQAHKEYPEMVLNTSELDESYLERFGSDLYDVLEFSRRSSRHIFNFGSIKRLFGLRPHLPSSRGN